MKQSSTYVYQLLKSAWGIRISITAGVQFRSGQTGGRVTTASPVWIAFTGSASRLPSVDKERLTQGLSEVAAEISKSVPGKPVTVTVEEVSYVESDFQIEGLSVAICRWAEDAFGLPARQITESFDRAANRYHFEWH
ncbi:hypothetical protein [Spongiactinospora sp. TRM90649]|uniref:hypothetical protein n=1 Tax=Spongiactinospora sp. TRM90649 TaxID=3031114 RepID=UPI0023F80CB5|nr:hypothetical protein [Spongiactinospora sp. TRM90649]MDF5759202.1 hypothetical protein [Spongiactinospora sp. TRM90649]